MLYNLSEKKYENYEILDMNKEKYLTTTLYCTRMIQQPQHKDGFSFAITEFYSNVIWFI